MWHYKIVKNYYTTEEELDMYGEEGQELVTVSYHRLYFKKWVEPAETTPTAGVVGPTVSAPVSTLETCTGSTGPMVTIPEAKLESTPVAKVPDVVVEVPVEVIGEPTTAPIVEPVTAEAPVVASV